MPGRRSARSTLSALFLAVAVGLFVLAGVLWLRGRDGESDQPPVPAATPGRNELIHVTTALEAEGLTVKTLPGGVHSRMLEGVGQLVTVNGVTAYVFIYQPDAAAREDATLDVEPAAIDLEDNAGDPVDQADLRLLIGSNVAVVLAGGDDGLAAKVAAALEGLP